MSKREGPYVYIGASCAGCVHERAEHYRVQGDSGTDVSCAHPAAPVPRTIGDTTWTTPAWCPLLDVAVDTLIRERKGGAL